MSEYLLPRTFTPAKESDENSVTAVTYHYDH